MALLRVDVLSIFVAAASALLACPASCTTTTTRRHDAEPLHQDLVTQLPGQPGVGFRHYAGYATVDEKNGRALFYWFFEATSGSDEKPLVLWLNGGPGCSSVGYGATQEIGPFLVDGEGYALKFNPYSWNKEANLLFLESPVGVGFSYSNTSSDYDILGDSFAANDAYSFLHEWYKKFPSYRNWSFYIAGESYAGKYVPELAELIYDKNNDSSLFINLKGFLLGNPETSDAQDWQGFVDYAWSHAIISDSTYKIIKDNCDFYSNDTWSNEKCKDAVDELLRQYKFIDMYSLYTSVCTQNSTSSDNGVMQHMMLRRSSNMMPRIMGNGYNPCLDLYAKTFYNRRDVQKALHVTQGQGNKHWSICNHQIFDGWKDSKPSLLPIYKKLIEGGLRIWVYSGDTDGRVPVIATRYCLNDLGLPVVGPWRPWYHQKQVRGWLQEYQGLTFATFRGAGHAVPVFEPSSSLALFASFLAGQPPSSG
ncbi:serine carboxypeptidase-like 31 [Iris pallida]|uniref:Carboxypeptidase n=1 Tax=Iris pallida TaxID=29817 RepID=A0AAX6GER1_IRIPA|nr:serine carboxypeptidase-like 31 [Iris pallida]